MEELRIPKRRVSVDVMLPDGKVRRVNVFLAEQATNHEGSERVSDLLNGEGEFLPAFDLETKTMTMMNRSAVLVARCPSEDEADLSAEFTIPTEHDVQVTMVNGDQLEGLITYVRPPENARLPDFLNDRSPFFALQEKEQVALVNKRHVARIVILNR